MEFPERPGLDEQRRSGSEGLMNDSEGKQTPRPRSAGRHQSRSLCSSTSPRGSVGKSGARLRSQTFTAAVAAATVSLPSLTEGEGAPERLVLTPEGPQSPTDPWAGPGRRRRGLAVNPSNLLRGSPW